MLDNMRTFFRVGSRLINTTPGGITDVELYASDPNHPDTPGVRINWGNNGQQGYSIMLSGQDAKELRAGCDALVLADIGRSTPLTHTAGGQQ
jgi:hypothetical protein